MKNPLSLARAATCSRFEGVQLQPPCQLRMCVQNAVIARRKPLFRAACASACASCAASDPPPTRGCRIARDRFGLAYRSEQAKLQVGADVERQHGVSQLGRSRRHGDTELVADVLDGIATRAQAQRPALPRLEPSQHQRRRLRVARSPIDLRLMRQVGDARRQLRTRVNAKLSQQGRHLIGNRALRPSPGARDRRVGVAVQQHRKDVTLRRRQKRRLRMILDDREHALRSARLDVHDLFS